MVSSENEKQTMREELVVRDADLKRAEEKIVAEKKLKQQVQSCLEECILSIHYNNGTIAGN